MNVLVDSCIWIEASKSTNPECIKLKNLIRNTNHTIMVPQIVRMEVCQGAKTEAILNKLWASFEGFDELKITDDIWYKATHFFFRCRKKGVTMGSVDCLIATLASISGSSLWTSDAIFKKTKDIFKIDLFEE